MGRKVSDEWTVPLCTTHHRSLHAMGNEERWWNERQIDSIIHAERLWGENRGEEAHLVPNARELIRPSPS